MENNDDLNFLYTSGSVETCDEMLTNWYDTAKSHMKKVNSIKDFTMAIYFFEMIESIRPNYKNCTKNIEKCKEKMADTRQFLAKTREIQKEQKQQRLQNEEQEKIKQQKQQKRNKIKRVFKSPYLYVLLAIVTIIVIILAYSLAFAISV